jgi:hypothetical protein
MELDEEVGWAGGYLATTLQADDKAWYSRDGASWERVKLPVAPLPRGLVRGRAPGLQLRLGTTDGRQVLLVGEQYHEPCNAFPGRTGPFPFCASSTVSWTTADGRHWQVSSGGEGPEDLLTAAWPVPGGWEAFGPDFVGDAVALGTDVYRSPDGRHWSLSDQLPLETDTDLFVLSSGTTRVAVVDHPGDYGFEQSVWVSTWQGPWERIPSSALPDEGYFLGAAPVPGGPDVWVLNGFSSVWTSRNLVDWTEHALLTDPVEDSCGVTNIAASPLGIVVIADAGATTDDGCGWDFTGLQSDSAGWISRDGDTWEHLPVPPLSTAADGPAGIVAMGKPDENGVVAVWRLVASLPHKNAL